MIEHHDQGNLKIKSLFWSTVPEGYEFNTLGSIEVSHRQVDRSRTLRAYISNYKHKAESDLEMAQVFKPFKVHLQWLTSSNRATPPKSFQTVPPIGDRVTHLGSRNSRLPGHIMVNHPWGQAIGWSRCHHGLPASSLEQQDSHRTLCRDRAETMGPSGSMLTLIFRFHFFPLPCDHYYLYNWHIGTRSPGRLGCQSQDYLF